MPQHFSNPDALQTFLTAHGLDLSLWGQGEAKTVANLWDELNQGETQLHDEPLFRVVTVVQVIVRRGNKILIEAEQELDHHRRRVRHHPPSEKVKTGEDYLAAAARCLEEELGVKRGQFEIDAASHQSHAREEDSPSYPGLRSRYIFHRLEASVDGLPTGDFQTRESSHNPLDPVRQHFWVWAEE